MKKLLLPLLALGACTQVSAQSTVTISGTMDLYLQRSKGSLTSNDQVSSGGNSTSKLVIRATEDLGNGMAAGLFLESGIAADTGAGQSTNTNNQPSGATPAGGLTFNRRSYVFLRGPWGEMHLGRDQSPTYDAYASRLDPFSVASGIGINYTASINPAAVRVSNDVAYFTPRWSGFSLQLHRWLGENLSTAANPDDGSGRGARLQYDLGALSALVHYARTDFAAGDGVYRGAGVVYDFGPAKASAVYNNDQQGMRRQRGALLGVWVPMGPHELKASYSFLRNKDASDAEARKLSLGYVYSFSKRTAVYATYAHIDNRHGASAAIAGSTTAPDHASSAMDLGIRHHF